MTEAVVHIGPLPKRDLIARFYDRCGLETVGAGRVAVGARIPFDTFDQLLDNMSNRSERFQIIVNHGTTTQGLIVPFAKGATHSATGEIMRQLSAAADRADSITGQAGPLVDLASKMGISKDATLRLIQRLAAVRGRAPFVEFRGCNIGADLGMLQRYKDAFGALSAAAPDCRMFFFAIRPHRPGKGETMTKLREGRPKTGKTRRRMFQDDTDFTLDAAGPLIIDVRDIDGHTQVDTESFMDHPVEASSWAIALNGTWRQSANAVGSSEFVLPVLWDNGETTYHTPLEFGYRAHLVRI